MQSEKEKSFSEPDEIAELSMLYDFYGPLLKDGHRQIFEDYVWNNLSLSEIAEECQITRQGVYDVVRRCRIRLRDYEDRLHQVEKFRVTKMKLREIEEMVSDGSDESVAGKIRKLAREICEII